jgi:peptidoglycan/LPS O-acetylase OafA/YrhL
MALPRSEHLATFDGLRGIAALSVVIFHLSLGAGNISELPKAYLAVDFFFLLSGFVIAKAYEQKLTETLSFLDFLKIRIIRLYPLLFLAMSAAFLTTLISAVAGKSEISYKIFGQYVFGILLLPHSLVSNSFMFPLDGVAWSLFAEIAVNVLYAATVMHWSTRVLAGVIAGAAVALVAVGWSNNAGGTNFGLNTGGLCNQILPGLVRSCFSFSVGVAIYRCYRTGRLSRLPRISGAWFALALLASFTALGLPWGWGYDLGCVMLLYPAMIVLGAMAEARAWMTRLFLWLGGISYPVYVLHPPLVTALGMLKLTDRLPPYLSDGIILAALVIVAWLALTFYDAPVRRALRTLLTAGKTKPVPEYEIIE